MSLLPAAKKLKKTPHMYAVKSYWCMCGKLTER